MADGMTPLPRHIPATPAPPVDSPTAWPALTAVLATIGEPATDDRTLTRIAERLRSMP